MGIILTLIGAIQVDSICLPGGGLMTTRLKVRCALAVSRSLLGRRKQWERRGRPGGLAFIAIQSRWLPQARLSRRRMSHRAASVLRCPNAKPRELRLGEPARRVRMFVSVPHSRTEVSNRERRLDGRRPGLTGEKQLKFSFTSFLKGSTGNLTDF
jgi:hypothetical protein